MAPYTDSKMAYDVERDRYVLTQDYCQYELNIDLNSNAVLQNGGAANVSNLPARFLRKVSDAVYAFLRHDRFENDTREWNINRSESGRKMLCRAMLTQAEYMLNAGEPDMYSSVNVATGQSMSQEELFRAGYPWERLVDCFSSLMENGQTPTYKGRLKRIEE